MSQKDNLDKLKGHSDIKQDINRRDNQQGKIVGKDSKKLEKRINDIRKVISDPDVWNVNIASRERIDALEERIEELEKKLKQKDSGVLGSGISPKLQKLLDEKKKKLK
jgi:polyhydroxyalkanoate synthesis regulator phasin